MGKVNMAIIENLLNDPFEPFPFLIMFVTNPCHRIIFFMSKFIVYYRKFFHFQYIEFFALVKIIICPLIKNDFFLKKFLTWFECITCDIVV